MSTVLKRLPLAKLTTILLALVLLFGGLGATARPAQASVESASACAEYHVVQRGEYLSQIAKEYEVSWRWLAEINDLAATKGPVHRFSCFRDRLVRSIQLAGIHISLQYLITYPGPGKGRISIPV